MSRWARHPPPPGRVRLVLAVVAICLAVVAIERLGLWPHGWQVNRLRP
ncbi:MAG: hypothetical protein QM656_13605 [Paracoccaceae bacterium]